jgi:hypothetical protein
LKSLVQKYLSASEKFQKLNVQKWCAVYVTFLLGAGTTGDITNSWGAMQGHVDGQESIPYIESFAGPGYFNDLDMMIVGNMSQDFCALAAAAACIL